MKKMLLIVAGLALSFTGRADTIYKVNAGETFEITSALNADGTTIQASEGAVITVPHRDVYARIWANGNITIRNATANVLDYVWLCNGIRVVTDADPNATLTIEGAKALQVGRTSLTTALHGASYVGYPPIDVSHLVFTEPDATGIVLRRKVTVRNLPEGHNVSVMEETGNDSPVVALQGTKSLLAFFSNVPNTLNMSYYDVLVATAASLPKGCIVNVPVGRTFTMRPSTVSAWTWSGSSTETGTYHINLQGKGARVRFRGTGVQTYCRSEIAGRGEVVIQSDNGGFRTTFRGRSYVSANASESIVLDIDDANLPPDESWKSKVAHWFDADKADSVIRFTYKSQKSGWESVKNEYDGHPIVIGWADAVTGTSDLFLYNTRIWTTASVEDDYVLQVMPYLVEGGLNGKNYISCGRLSRSMPNTRYNSAGALITAAEARRLRVWQGGGSGSSKPTGNYKDFGTTPYCIMVYGSENGGGKAMFGTDGVAGHGNLARSDSKLEHPWTAYNGFALYADGFSVNPKTEKPSGGWQILSLDMTGTNTVINAIGRHQSDAASGGQDYAEIIFFSEKPTDAERAACELYLAKKWGLANTYTRTINPAETLVGKSDGLVELWDSQKKEADPNAVVTLAGDYKGKIVVPEGRTLVVADKPAPPREGDIPAEGRVGWFDPSVADALELNPADKTGVHIEKFWGRDLDGLKKTEGDYWLSGQHSANSTGRCAGKKGRPNGVWSYADNLTWLDYSHRTGGNTMRFHNSLSTATTSTSATPIDTREGFIVLDSSLGGGNLFGSDVGFTKNIRPRMGNDVNDPIWSASNTLSMAGTWLDTTAVDGATQGFSGKGEVLTFEAASTFPIGFFGYYNNNGYNYEKMGEILLYNRALTAEERLLTQEYLMYKWLGDLNGKYSDLSGATVSGAGTVKAASLAALPRYGADFTGATEITAEDLVISSANTVAVKGDLSFPNLKAVTVNAPRGTFVVAGSTGTITLPTAKIPVTFADGKEGVMTVENGQLMISPRNSGTLILVM